MWQFHSQVGDLRLEEPKSVSSEPECYGVSKVGSGCSLPPGQTF